MSDDCICGKPVPASSHSPWFCSVACDVRWRNAMYGEQQPTPVSEFPDTQLSTEGMGQVRWSALSWWPHPLGRWFHRQDERRRAS